MSTWSNGDEWSHNRLSSVSASVSAQDSEMRIPEISIVLPCLNEEKAIGACIDTIASIIATRGLNAEILVVDNASVDRS
ncbi:MAG: glycosyltransferase family 2 protein, partial [Ktedonobacterales bacterium]